MPHDCDMQDQLRTMLIAETAMYEFGPLPVLRESDDDVRDVFRFRVEEYRAITRGDLTKQSLVHMLGLNDAPSNVVRTRTHVVHRLARRSLKSLCDAERWLTDPKWAMSEEYLPQAHHLLTALVLAVNHTDDYVDGRYRMLYLTQREYKRLDVETLCSLPLAWTVDSLIGELG